MTFDKDKCKLSTGKSFYSNNGIIGISKCEGFGFTVTEGYDGGVDTNSFTTEEKRELADYMINLWTEFKNYASEGDKNGK